MPTPEVLIKPFLADDDRAPRTLRAKVVTHVGSIRAAAVHNELLPVDLAEVIAKRIIGLLDDLEKLPAEHQKLILAAARYFMSDADHRQDTKDAMGLDDDLMVLNFVAGLSGRTSSCGSSVCAMGRSCRRASTSACWFRRSRCGIGKRIWRWHMRP
jgi:hypothetical protein